MTEKSVMHPLVCVVACEQSKNGIGLNGDLPWAGTMLKEDMRFFRQTTSSTEQPDKTNAVIMGRRTWESIPNKFKPLKNRLNVVLTSGDQSEYPDGVIIEKRLEAALARLDQRSDLETVFVIGGGRLYAAAMHHERCKTVYLTRIYASFDSDVQLSPTAVALFEENHGWEPGQHVHEQDGLRFRFTRLDKPAHRQATGTGGEHQYLALVREIIDTGVQRGDRTGTGTLSVFGRQMRFSLRNHSFPLLTTKRVFWRGVAEELLWFVRGSTNANLLAAKKVHIWDANGSREFLDGRGLTDRAEGDLGPVYGFQWRHFGAEYSTMDTDYTGQGVDQLAECVRQLKENPTSRRILFSAWNPAALPAMALPPCHILCQFYVANGELSAQMYQRSADMGLGVPFNIASYSLLTYMMAHVCGLKPGDFVHVLGDAHVYLNHVEPLREQLERSPAPQFPKLFIKRQVSSLDDFQMEDFDLQDYKPQKTIKMEMAV